MKMRARTARGTHWGRKLKQGKSEKFAYTFLHKFVAFFFIKRLIDNSWDRDACGLRLHRGNLPSHGSVTSPIEEWPSIVEENHIPSISKDG